MKQHAGPELPFWAQIWQTGPHLNLVHLFGARDGTEACLVDPTFELGALRASTAGRTWVAALVTHGHWDHIGGLPEAVQLGCKDVYVPVALAEHPKVREAKEAGAAVHGLEDQDHFRVAGLPVDVFHTPGHQPEATCYLIGEAGSARALATGDTLFIGSCGRTDFPGGDTDAMFASMARMRTLADPDVHVLPGHHYGQAPVRPLTSEVQDNPALAATDRAAFGRLACLTD